MAIWRPNIDGNGPVDDLNVDETSSRPIRLTQYRQYAHSEVIEYTKFLNITFLKFLFRQRKEFDISRTFGRVYDRNTARDALQTETPAYGARERIIHGIRNVADLDPSWIAFSSRSHGGKHLYNDS